MWRRLAIVLLLGGCLDQGTSGRPVFRLNSVEQALRNGANILRVRLTNPGAATEYSIGEHQIVQYIPWQMDVVGQIVSGVNVPPASRGTFIQEIGSRAETGEITSLRWGPGEPGRPTIESGREYLFYCLTCRMEFLAAGNHGPLHPLAADGTLVEAAFGFPARTSSRTVLDTSGVDPSLLYSSGDASVTPPDAAIAD